jgi:hypothetical protein
MKPLAMLTGAAVLLAACAGAQQEAPLTISEVTVNADLASIGSSEAVSYWQGLSGDLETAIANEFVGRIDPTGETIVVDVDELSLNSPFVAGATAETARLSGRVELFNTAGTSEGAYNITASAQDVADFLPTGTLTSVPPTSTDYYRAIVQAFARGVEVTLSGSS